MNLEMVERKFRKRDGRTGGRKRSRAGLEGCIDSAPAAAAAAAAAHATAHMLLLLLLLLLLLMLLLLLLDPNNVYVISSSFA